MRLDHISYAATNDQLSTVVQRLGARLGSTFVDGGIHPRFGTRNFTLALKNGLYLEVVCPLDHPAADSSPFGRAVSQRASEGGGWLTWVVATPDISIIESRLGRSAVEGHRLRPDGTDLRWKQIGVLGTLEDQQLPFFIQWESKEHPSQVGEPIATIERIEIAGNVDSVAQWLGENPQSLLEGIDVEWVNPQDNEGETGIVAVTLSTPSGSVRLD